MTDNPYHILENNTSPTLLKKQPPPTLSINATTLSPTKLTTPVDILTPSRLSWYDMSESEDDVNYFDSDEPWTYVKGHHQAALPQKQQEQVEHLIREEEEHKVDDLVLQLLREPLPTGQWVIYYDEGAGANNHVQASPVNHGGSTNWEQFMSNKPVGSFKNIEGFWKYWNNLEKELNRSSRNYAYFNLRFFRKGVKPSYEDVKNRNGGKFVVQIDKAKRGALWSAIVLSVVSGEKFDDDDITGLVLSSRTKFDSIHLWIGAVPNNNTAYIEEMKKKIKNVLTSHDPGASVCTKGYPQNLEVNVTYQSHEESLKLIQQSTANGPRTPTSAARRLQLSPPQKKHLSVKKPKLARQFSTDSASSSTTSSPASSAPTTPVSASPAAKDILTAQTAFNTAPPQETVSKQVSQKPKEESKKSSSSLGFVLIAVFIAALVLLAAIILLNRFVLGESSVSEQLRTVTSNLHSTRS